MNNTWAGTSVLISYLELRQSRLAFDALLAAYGIRPDRPYLQIDCPTLEAHWYLQSPPTQEDRRDG